MTIRKWGVTLRWPQLLAIGIMLVAVVVLAFTLATLVRGVQDTSTKTDRLLEQLADTQTEDTREASEHRDFNQHDHDCIVALALELADPTRDREVPPRIPPACVRAPGNP